MTGLTLAFFQISGTVQCNKDVLNESVRTGAKLVSEYDQEIPQSQTADNPVAPQGRAAQPSSIASSFNIRLLI